MPGPGVDPGTGVRANLRRGVVTPPYRLRLCAHRRGGIYAARGFTWAAVGGSVVGEGFIPPGMSTPAQASAGRRGRRPLQQSVGGMSAERHPVGAGHARPGGDPETGVRANPRRGVVTPPYGLRLCAHRRGGIYAARGFTWAAVGGSVVGEGFIPPGMSTPAQASAGRRGRRPLQQSVGGMSAERHPVGAGHARPGGDPETGVRANPRRGVVTPPYGLRLCAHRRGGIYAARGFTWAAVGGRSWGPALPH